MRGTRCVSWHWHPQPYEERLHEEQHVNDVWQIVYYDYDERHIHDEQNKLFCKIVGSFVPIDAGPQCRKKVVPSVAAVPSDAVPSVAVPSDPVLSDVAPIDSIVHL